LKRAAEFIVIEGRGWDRGKKGQGGNGGGAVGIFVRPLETPLPAMTQGEKEEKEKRRRL